MLEGGGEVLLGDFGGGVEELDGAGADAGELAGGVGEEEGGFGASGVDSEEERLVGWGHSVTTALTRLRGWSTSMPRPMAMK
ncbi:MAG: hypothetical protein NVSMB62_18900 [Acidobacteriaceae bacterium]